MESELDYYLTVFPTPVGMDRLRKHFAILGLSFPHTRGDGPLTSSHFAMMRSFSPHPWGWTVHTSRTGDGHRVFPTPVGMDRVGQG